jgi:hypothetical protein
MAECLPVVVVDIYPSSQGDQPVKQSPDAICTRVVVPAYARSRLLYSVADSVQHCSEVADACWRARHLCFSPSWFRTLYLGVRGRVLGHSIVW